MKAIAAAVSFLFATGAASAADAPFAHTDCKNAPTQMEMDYCAGLDFKAADAKLNALYRQMTAKYDPADKEKLKAAEKAWLAYRDAECDYETAQSEGGSIHPMVETECATDKTQARIKELERQFHCDEGDTSCNNPG
jgi:uncharacterized protein YecT (DUF1311 family)